MSQEPKKKPRVLTPFVVGVVVGLLIAFLGPRVLRPYLPAQPEADEVRGVVRDKGRQGEDLLLTIPTPNGTMLATFTENVQGIDLLVQVGDSITLGLDAYTPFSTDPPITRVGTALRPLPVDTSAAAEVPPPTQSRPAEPPAQQEPDSIQ